MTAYGLYQVVIVNRNVPDLIWTDYTAAMSREEAETKVVEKAKEFSFMPPGGYALTHDLFINLVGPLRLPEGYKSTEEMK